MRTTLTLDDDVAEKLKAEMRRRGTSFKETVNQCLRQGLERPRPEDLARPFRVEARSLGLRPGVQLDNVAGLLDALDGPTRR
jgi:predicted phage gp36 major capsid-like protein